MSMHSLARSTTGALLGLLVSIPVSAQNLEDSALDPKTGQAIQSASPLPSTTKRGHCNPANTRCQLPLHPVQPKDSDLNAQTESGRRLNQESSLNNDSRTGPVIAVPPPK